MSDVTMTVADGKDMLYLVDAFFRQTGDELYVDCDVAGKIDCIDA